MHCTYITLCSFLMFKIVTKYYPNQVITNSLDNLAVDAVADTYMYKYEIT